MLPQTDPPGRVTAPYVQHLIDRPYPMAPTDPPNSSQLGRLNDGELEQLAVSWRAQALRGDRKAHGIAHALEVAHRQRLRASQVVQLPESETPSRPRWKFWAASKTPRTMT